MLHFCNKFSLKFFILTQYDLSLKWLPVAVRIRNVDLLSRQNMKTLSGPGFLSLAWLSWPCSNKNFSSSDSALVLEQKAPHWAGSQESTEATEIPPPKTQDIPNQFDYSFAWKLLGPFEPKWLSCFTDGLFQILREEKKWTRRIK